MSEQIELYDSKHTGPVIDDAIDRILKTPGTGGISPETIGAAPAGYGLGSKSGRLLTEANDLNDVKENGWYWIGNSAPNNGVTNANSGKYGYYTLFVAFGTENDGNLFAIFKGGWILKRGYNVTTGWSPWESITGYGELGVEYRTTERYLGKPVYVKAIETGALPAAGGVENRIRVYTQVGAESDIFAWNITIKSGLNVRQDPFASNGGIYGYAYLGGNGTVNSQFYIETTMDMSDNTGVIVMKYTKSTD